MASRLKTLIDLLHVPSDVALAAHSTAHATLSRVLGHF
jgi:hypothetical protein